MQDLTPYDLEFYELSMIADDPEKLSKLQNTFYDEDFDDFLEEFDREQEENYKLQSKQDEKSEQSNELDMPDEETIEWADKNRFSQQEDTPEPEFEDDYEISLPADEISDWEEVN